MTKGARAVGLTLLVLALPVAQPAGSLAVARTQEAGVPDSDERDCERIELGSHGEWRLRIDGADRVVRLRGIALVDELAPATVELIARLRDKVTPVRCRIAIRTATEEVTASVRYLAWRDKSGDVWEDLAATLLDRGLARVAPGNFPEREQYLSRERAARTAACGLAGGKALVRAQKKELDMSTSDRFISADTGFTFEPADRQVWADSKNALQEEEHGQSRLPVPDAAAPQLLQRFAVAHGANAPLRTAALLRTQQTYGNRAVQRSVAPIQTKMAISEPGDSLEQEADRVAEQAMTGEECECGGTCEECQAGAARKVQTKPSAGAAARQASAASQEAEGIDLDTRLAQRAGGGQPLAEGARTFAESRLGHDFGDVRVHTDPEASDLAASIDAEAFTTGSDIYFRDGRHDPESQDGQRLLTHELTHVVQQRSTPRLAQRRAAAPAADRT
jgi:Domain of unknown function (DUF4157)